MLLLDVARVKQIIGAPRHSKRNGGIETINKTFEGKMMNWMLEMNSLAWAIGHFYAV